jgi:hypothetical protein
MALTDYAGSRGCLETLLAEVTRRIAERKAGRIAAPFVLRDAFDAG